MLFIAECTFDLVTEGKVLSEELAAAFSTADSTIFNFSSGAVIPYTNNNTIIQ